MKQKKTSYESRKFFLFLIDKSGIDFDFYKISKIILNIALSIISVFTTYLLIQFMLNKTFVSDALLILLVLWSLGLLLIFGVAWAIFFIYIDLKIYKRQREVELVFPDFLQLAAANINAGLPIDRALWYAIRPKFGVLAKEMELVAKSTMVGEKLDKALIQFSERYDSPNIKRALNLLLVGLESGGEIGDLLTRIAINMRETEIIKKEMASNVMTYVIFILFATLGAAPFLFALTSELIVIMNSIFSNINISEGGSFGGIGGMLTSGNSISIVDYQIFAIVSVIISSVFSAIIISVIQKGNAKEAFKKIPLYVLIGVTNYFVSYNLLHLMLGGFFK